ncbi:unnamed protein product [Chilo suppressalis]|uniref:Ion transport domain-containing protein n=1 Tax=Chilo suppressalis TaxID=168631 RepID=A0ABN8AYE3_CHISP|nr:unnamed protein product [Chilo suppressalis]
MNSVRSIAPGGRRKLVSVQTVSDVNPFLLPLGQENTCYGLKRPYFTRFRKNYIHRFTATRSLFWWSPWSPVRRACVYLSTNQYFDYFVMATILLNCVFLAMSETIEEAEMQNVQSHLTKCSVRTNHYFDFFFIATILLNRVFLAMSVTIEEAEMQNVQSHLTKCSVRTNHYFDFFFIATILLNRVFLAMSETIEEAEGVLNHIGFIRRLSIHLIEGGNDDWSRSNLGLVDHNDVSGYDWYLILHHDLRFDYDFFGEGGTTAASEAWLMFRMI